ncbi:VOC family protein [Bacillus sp. 1P06AnD]|uniref:VOC family protein n=1 Tax=Bacillus sp. 1P06AnD TaxID=3132208 RepID=UPI0039A326A5
MLTIKPYIITDHCEEAMNYYKNILGGEIKNVHRAKEMPMFKGNEGKILQAQLHIGNQIIHFSDTFHGIVHGDAVKIILEFHEVAEIERVYGALKLEGKIHLELQETFWGATHANLTDKYGVGWVLNYEHSK